MLPTTPVSSEADMPQTQEVADDAPSPPLIHLGEG